MTHGKATQKQTSKRKALYGKVKNYADQEGAFFKALEEAEACAVFTTEQWYVLSGIYRGLKEKTDVDQWKADWESVKRYRKGLIQDPTPRVNALAQYEMIWVEMRKSWARTTGYNAERERKRKAKDPTAYREANTERQRRRRARLKAKSLTPASSPSNDQQWDADEAAQ